MYDNSALTRKKNTKSYQHLKMGEKIAFICVNYCEVLFSQVQLQRPFSDLAEIAERLNKFVMEINGLDPNVNVQCRYIVSR